MNTYLFEKLRQALAAGPEQWWGRVIRGNKQSDFEHLSQPFRKLAWVFDQQGLSSLISKTDLQILLDIGLKRERIATHLGNGMRWKMILFSNGRCRLGDWDGLFAMVGESYGDAVARCLDRHAEALRTRGNPLSPFKAAHLGQSCIREDPNHPDHMTPERFMALNWRATADDAWVFLWHSVGINDRYTGTGHCLRDDGAFGREEYLTHNKRISSLPDATLIDMHVALDQEGPVSQS